MAELKYTITGNTEVDSILDFLAGDSEREADRFKYNVGDRVSFIIESNRPGVFEIRGRRNAYPKPFFQGCWMPIYFVNRIDGESDWNGEWGEDFFIEENAPS